MSRFMLHSFVVSASLLLFPIVSSAQAHKGISFQAVIKLPSGEYPTKSGLTVNSYILSSNNCILREEQFTGVNVSNGYINIPIGTGTVIGGDPGLTMKEVMDNSSPIVSGLVCLNENGNVNAGVTSFDPTTGDGRRKFRLSIVIDGVPVVADFNMRSMAYAISAETADEAKKLNGKSDADFIQASSQVTQSTVESWFTSTMFSNILNNQYVASSLSPSANLSMTTDIVTSQNLRVSKLVTAGTLYLYDSAATPASVGLKAPANIVAAGGSSYVLTLPANKGVTGQILAAKDDAGTLGWIDSNAVSVTLAGDVSSTGFTNGTVSTTVNKIKNVTITGAPTLDGQVFRMQGGQLQPGFVSMLDLRSNVTGSLALSASCAANQTLTFNSATDSLKCENISITKDQVAGLGALALKGSVDLSSAEATGILPVASGGTGSATGSITGTEGLTFTAGGINQNVTLTPSGTGATILNGKVGVGKLTPVSVLHTSFSGVNFAASTVNRGGPFFQTVHTANVNGSYATNGVYSTVNPLAEVGVTDSGVHVAGLFQSLRNIGSEMAGDSGSVNELYGISSGAGHYDSNAVSPNTTNVYGLRSLIYHRSGSITNAYGLMLNDSGGAPITNFYGIYQAAPSAKNYFAGNLGIGTSTPSNFLSISSFGTDHTKHYILNKVSSTSANWQGVPGVSLVKNHNSDETPGATLDAEELGEYAISGTSLDGTNFNAASIKAIQVGEASASGPVGAQIRFMTASGNGSALTNRMVIDNLGNVGIGTTSPSVGWLGFVPASPTQMMTLNGGASAAPSLNSLRETNSAYGSYIQLLKSRAGGPVQANDDIGYLRWAGKDSANSYAGFVSMEGKALDATNATHSGYLTIKVAKNGSMVDNLVLTGGNVGIATSTPGATLDVKGHIANSGAAATVGSCGTSPVINGNDNRGSVTTGSGTVNSCVVTFNSAYTSSPFCVVSWNGIGASTIGISSVATTTTLTVYFSVSSPSVSFNYHCTQ